MKYIGKDPLSKDYIHIPHGTTGIVLHKADTGARIMWLNKKGLRQHSLRFVSTQGSNENQIVIPNFGYGFDTFVLVRDNHVPYKQLFDRHFT
ncbi:hypothetical protein EXS74_03755 [Candidatus Woesearchaeota archaeon]|nr:hypothetical protein [Candidatus Woesearchaeota archaeon]